MIIAQAGGCARTSQLVGGAAAKPPTQRPRVAQDVEIFLGGAMGVDLGFMIGIEFFAPSAVTILTVDIKQTLWARSCGRVIFL